MSFPSDAWIQMRVKNHMHRFNDLKLLHAETKA